MTRCANCTLRDRAEGCPLRGTPRFPCGYDKEEIKRRRKLPLVLDEMSGLRRKLINSEVDDG